MKSDSCKSRILRSPASHAPAGIHRPISFWGDVLLFNWSFCFILIRTPRLRENSLAHQKRPTHNLVQPFEDLPGLSMGIIAFSSENCRSTERQGKVSFRPTQGSNASYEHYDSLSRFFFLSYVSCSFACMDRNNIPCRRRDGDSQYLAEPD